MPVNHVEPGEKTAGADNASSSFLQEGSGAQLGEANTNQNQNMNQIKKKGDTTPTAADSEVGSKRQDNLTFSTGKGAQTGAEAVSVRVKIRVRLEGGKALFFYLLSLFLSCSLAFFYSAF